MNRNSIVRQGKEKSRQVNKNGIDKRTKAHHQLLRVNRKGRGGGRRRRGREKRATETGEVTLTDQDQGGGRRRRGREKRAVEIGEGISLSPSSKRFTRNKTGY